MTNLGGKEATAAYRAIPVQDDVPVAVTYSHGNDRLATGTAGFQTQTRDEDDRGPNRVVRCIAWILIAVSLVGAFGMISCMGHPHHRYHHNYYRRSAPPSFTSAASSVGEFEGEVVSVPEGEHWNKDFEHGHHHHHMPHGHSHGNSHRRPPPPNGPSGPHHSHSHSHSHSDASDSGSHSRSHHRPGPPPPHHIPPFDTEDLEPMSDLENEESAASNVQFMVFGNEKVEEEETVIRVEEEDDFKKY